MLSNINWSCSLNANSIGLVNPAKVQALKELNYTEINEKNAAEVLEKIAEIQSRKVTN